MSAGLRDFKLIIVPPDSQERVSDTRNTKGTMQLLLSDGIKRFGKIFVVILDDRSVLLGAF
jgi:hypothetical protein